eukprot:CAMPEP_0173397022 /NCGR_PEP_ID=MMETSP1356-20130122/37188_1 /TAXON_ID=77927 ORGANISM="Hemiselmis virescens, Strain PCC157" /NCGR_SAMPLE_ID=MMETSP1356 /ASSEMBLY_ACC=CAM_ASM_000847 /LENGTH=98 /DNA_ID=CAMNT_0014356185 /DNA_START=12 /DNA_END=304 /DNA_ORIENTATION=-
MGGAMLKMTSSLKQSLAMMNQMNTCMEEYVRSGLVLSATLSNPKAHSADGTAGPILTVSARNTSRVPMSGVTLSVSLKTAAGAADPALAPSLSAADPP